MRGSQHQVCMYHFMVRTLQPTSLYSIITSGSVGFSNAKNLLPPLRRNSEQIEKKTFQPWKYIILFSNGSLVLVSIQNWITFMYQVSCYHPKIINWSAHSPISLGNVSPMGRRGTGDWYALRSHLQSVHVDQKKLE